MSSPDRTLRRFGGYSMKRAFNAIQSDVNETLAPFGLRMVTFSALSVIIDSPGLRQSQLADVLSIERPNLVLIIDGLESRDLIMRQRASDDRRAYALQATLVGRRLHDRALKALDGHEARVMAGLTEQERLALIDMLMRIEATGRSEDAERQISGA